MSIYEKHVHQIQGESIMGSSGSLKDLEIKERVATAILILNEELKRASLEGLKINLRVTDSVDGIHPTVVAALSRQI